MSLFFVFIKTALFKCPENRIFYDNHCRARKFFVLDGVSVLKYLV